MDKFLLSTNDNQIATNFSSLLEGKAEVHIFPRYTLNQLESLSEDNFCSYSYFVLGVNNLTEEDLIIFKKLTHFPVEKMLLVRKLEPETDIEIAREYGVSRVLIDPLEKVKYAMENFKNIIEYLSHSENGKECHHYKGEELYVIEKGLYFHTSEIWVGNFAKKHYLSNLECSLLELFIKYEGKVLSVSTIADELWDGQIEESSIRKLVKRLREKLGDPSLIVGRRQGGYIFKKKD